MKKQKETFASLLLSFEYHFDMRTVFEDLLTMSMCSLTQDFKTGKSHYEDLYMQTVAKYAKHDIRFKLPQLFALLVMEMEERFDSDTGNDVLGEFYEQHLYSKGRSQYFTPWPICTLMTKCMVDRAKATNPQRPLHILEPACGSGRMLLAARKEIGTAHEYYAVDTDPVCCKKTALNLFLNGVFHAEVMCGNALFPDDFAISYRLSKLPLGIFRIEEKEQSQLYHMLKSTIRKEPRPTTADEKVNSGLFSKDTTQLKFF